MYEIKFDLYQDRDTGEVTILPWVIGADRVGLYGDVVILTEEDFRTEGMKTIIKVLESSLVDSRHISTWTNRDQLPTDTHIKKPRTISLEPIWDRREATIHIMHYDNTGLITPCEIGEVLIAPLGTNFEVFAAVVFEAFALSKDFKWIEFGLWKATAFFCLYRDDRSRRYYWFDWVRVDLPAPHKDAVTAWGSHRAYEHQEIRRQGRCLTVKSLHDFPCRRECENPNRNPRGSQVEESGVAVQKRVVIFQLDDPSMVYFRAYNFDSANHEQVESGVELYLHIDSSDVEFDNMLTTIFDYCEIE